MSLAAFPAELIYHTIEYLSQEDLNAFVQTSRFYYQFNTTLYDVDRRQGSSALMWAAAYGDTHTAQHALPTKKVSPEDRKCIQQAFRLAVENSHCAMVVILAKWHADINARGGFFGNALQTAAWMGDYRMVALLIDLGANVNTQGGYYGNALQVASWRASWTGNDNVLELLLRADANVNAEGGYFGNALQAAAWGGRLHTMRLLLKSGAQPNTQGGYYGSSLQAASWRGHKHVVRLLLQLGARADAPGGHYGSAIKAAGMGGHRLLLCLLYCSCIHQTIRSSFGHLVIALGEINKGNAVSVI